MRPNVAAAIAVLLAVVIGACGDDDATGGNDATGDRAATEIEATGTEFRFDPSSWTVPAGEEATIAFANAGTLEHQWVIIDLGEDIESEAELEESKVLFEVDVLPRGESAEESFTVDESGTYQVICAVPTHFDAGMEGALTVE